MRKKHQAGCPCCPGDTCYPCAIPAADLTLSYRTVTPVLGAGPIYTATLHLQSVASYLGTPPYWISDCLTATDSDPYAGYTVFYRVVLSCSPGGRVTISTLRYPFCPGPTGFVEYCSLWPTPPPSGSGCGPVNDAEPGPDSGCDSYSNSYLSWTCDPFVIRFRTVSSEFPTIPTCGYLYDIYVSE